MVAVTGNSPSRLDGSGSVSFASFNIRSGRNGGLEGALRAMDQMGVDIGFLTGGIYTRYSSGYSFGGAIIRTRLRRCKFGGRTSLAYS
jgi:hypothetical protein